VNKVVLTGISALVGFLRKIVTSVYRYEEDKEWRRFVSVGKGNNPLELGGGSLLQNFLRFSKRS
jgi:hypothetical protein